MLSRHRIITTKEHKQKEMDNSIDRKVKNRIASLR